MQTLSTSGNVGVKWVIVSQGVKSNHADTRLHASTMLGSRLGPSLSRRVTVSHRCQLGFDVLHCYIASVVFVWMHS